MKEIRQILKSYDNSDLSREKLALATVVNVEESAYRRIGARMLVSSNGNWIGGISGGCLEGDALKRSQLAIYKNSPSKVAYDTMDDDANQIGVGLGCNGRVEVLFCPIDEKDADNPIEVLRKIEAQNKAVVSISLIDGNVAENELGNRILAPENLDDISFLGVDPEILRDKVMQAFEKRRSIVLNTVDGKERSIKLLFEFIRPEMRLVIVGDNYDVNALVAIVAELGWNIYLVGRKRKMHKDTFLKTKAVFEYEDYDKVPVDEYTSILLMTHDFNWDKTILKKVIPQKPIYVGMLGPKKRRIKMENEEGLEGLSELDFLYSPVGLDIGAESPEEIAVSIVSEILAVFRNRDGKKLKHRPGTIHERV